MPHKILLVDDEPNIQDLVRQKFRAGIKSGLYQFDYAENGAVALEKLQTDDTIDLIFTDINMPVMDGLTLLSKIKEHNLLPRAIVISAYGDLTNIRMAMNRGAFDFVTKPIDMVDLETTLHKTIEEMDTLKKGLEARRSLEQALIDKADAQQQALESLQEKERLILEQNEMLEKQVAERTSELQLQKEVIEIKNKEILDSIHYASHLQEAILPPVDSLNTFFKENFVLYKPKDIVAGDFYWIEPVEDGVMVVVADCTGHGVAGALMSMLGVSLLNHIVQNQGELVPANILNKLHVAVVKALQQEQSHRNEGMDIAICRFNFTSNELQYAGANRPLVYTANHELHLVAADKIGIGGMQYEQRNYFNHVMPFAAFDALYLFTDGYADQFGGPNGKKLMTTKFKETLLQLKEKSMEEQHAFLRNYFDSWKGSNEQVDDVLVMGLKI